MNKILIVILIIGAFLVGKLLWKTPPISSSTDTPNVVSMGEDVQVRLITDPDPLVLGPANFIVEVKDLNGKPVDEAKIFFDLNMTAMDMGTQQGNATPQGNGRYSVVGRMTMSGPWRIKMKVTLPDGYSLDKDFIVTVK